MNESAQMDQPSPALDEVKGPPRLSAAEAKFAPPARRSNKPFIILAAVLALVAALCLVYWLLNRGYAATDDAEIDGSIYTIAPEIAGRVTAVAVDDNQHVTAGQVLVTLDPRGQQIALAQARADTAQLQAQLAVASAAADEAAANVAQAAATLAQAQQDFNRYRSINPHAISQQSLDAATATIKAAQAKFAALQASAAGKEAAVTAARAQAEAAQAAVQNAQLQLSYDTITAPAAGHVSMKTVETGNVVAPGTSLLALVGDDVWVTANYKETQLAGIRSGAAATVRVDAVPGIAFKAHVASIQYGTGQVFSLLPAQNATGNYIKIVQRVPVKLVFDDNRVGQYLLAPGMSATPSISIAK